MDIRQLRYFLSVFDQGSILKASQHMYVSQQALSKTIAALEKELNVTLFERTHKGISPTPAGLKLKDLAIPVVEAMDNLYQSMSPVSENVFSTVNFAAVSGLSFIINKTDLEAFIRSYPNHNITYVDSNDAACLNMVLNGENTMAIVPGYVNNPDVMVIPLTKRQRVAIVRKDSVLASKSVLHISDFKDTKLVSHINSKCYSRFMESCRNQNFEPEFFRIGDTHAMFDAIDNYGYTGIMIDYMLLRYRPSFANAVAIPIDMDEFPYPVELIMRPEVYGHKIMRDIVDFIKSKASEREKQTLEYPLNL